MNGPFGDYKLLIVYLGMLVHRAGGEIKIENPDEFHGFETELSVEHLDECIVIRGKMQKAPFVEIPRMYRQPFGSPYYWRDIEGGNLIPCTVSFIDAMGKGQEPSQDDLIAVIDYLQYYLDAPVWNDQEKVDVLREQAAGLSPDNPKSVDDLIQHCVNVGIDPL